MAGVRKLDLFLDLVFSAPFILFTALYSISGPLIITAGTIWLTFYLTKNKVGAPAGPPEPVRQGVARLFSWFISRSLQAAIIVVGVVASVIEYQIRH